MSWRSISVGWLMRRVVDEISRAASIGFAADLLKQIGERKSLNPDHLSI
jgi:hypothetical protein